MKKLALILLPGLLSDAEVWAHQIRHLSDLSDIIIPDLNNASSPEEMVEAVSKIAPPYFALAGHSMGGWVALEVMKHFPERIVGLALLNTTALPDSAEKHRAREAMILQAENGNYSEIIDKLISAFIHNTAVIPKAKIMFERNKLAFINQEKSMLQREDCLAVLENISTPTLIIHAENDLNFNLTDSQLLADKIKSATLSIINNCGHMSPMEAPEKVTSLMRLWFENLTVFRK